MSAGLCLAQRKPANSESQQPPSASSQILRAPLAFGLEDGTPIRIRITRTISSADAKVDEKVDFEVLEDIKIGDIVVIPRGGIAWGTVTEAQAKRRMARGGKLNVNIDAVRLTSGEKAALPAVKELKDGGHTGAMTVKTCCMRMLFSGMTMVNTTSCALTFEALRSSARLFAISAERLARVSSLETPDV